LHHPLSARLGDGSTGSFTSVLTGLQVAVDLGGQVFQHQNLSCVVVDDDLGLELVLGRPTLRHWGLDPSSMAQALGVMQLAHARSAAVVTSFAPVVPYPTAKDAPFEDVFEDEPFDAGFTSLPADYTDEDAAIAAILDAKVQEAVAKGLHDADRLRRIFAAHPDILRINVRPDPPVDCPPLEVHLRLDATPIRMKPVRYPPAEKAFLADLLPQLVDAGLLKKQLVTPWATNARVVSKASGGFRLVGGYRRVNGQLEILTGPMPFLDELLPRLKGAKYFASLDNFKGFWGIPLADSCQEFFTLQAGDLGLFVPTRVPQGTTAAAQYYQAVMQDTLGDLDVLVWLDDCLLYAETEEELLSLLEAVIGRLDARGFKLAANKVELFASELIWCGQLISGDGVRPDPARIQGLHDAPAPETWADLQYFVHAAGWMRKHIPHFAAIFQPLRSHLDAHIAAHGRRCIKARLSSDEWPASMAAAYAAAKDALASAALCAHPDPRLQRCAFTDASDKHWAVVLTQCPTALADTDPAAGHMQPLAFLSGSFAGSQLDWSTADKEAFAIMQAFRKGGHLVLGVDLHLYTDHRNLAYIFAGQGTLACYSARLRRWADELSGLCYTVHHIAGVRNIWADLISRGLGPAPPAPSITACSLRISPSALQPGSLCLLDGGAMWQGSDSSGLAFVARVSSVPARGPIVLCTLVELPPVPLPLATPFAPSISQVARWQAAFHDSAYTGEEWTLRRSRIGRVLLWLDCSSAGASVASFSLGAGADASVVVSPLPADDCLVSSPDTAEGRICLMVAAHQGLAGHRQVEATVSALRHAGIHWDTLQDDVHAFVHRCLCCVDARGRPVPRQLGSQIHASSPGEVLHLDFLDMGSLSGAFQSLLVLMDDFSKFCWLVPCLAKTSAVAAESLISFASLTGIPATIISDGGSHFTAGIIEDLAVRLGADHHVTVAYSPWANGTVERLNREVLKVFRALCSEYRLASTEWSYLTTTVQYSLNHAATASLASHTPSEVLLGSRGARPLSVFLRPEKRGGYSLQQSDPSVVAHHVEDLRQRLASLHREVATSRHRRNQRDGFPSVNFTVGDFVLWARPSRVDKLKAKRVGPFRVIAVTSPWVYTIEHLLTGAQRSVHVDRLQFYCDRDLNVDVDLLDHIAFNEQGEFEVDHIVRLLESDDGDIQARVRWAGFEAADDTLESLEAIFPSCRESCLDALFDPARCDEHLHSRILVEFGLKGIVSLTKAELKTYQNKSR
jgi:hypothetical protein